MASFFGGGAAGGGGGSGVQDQQQRKDQLKQQIQVELATANAQMLINKMNEHCFEKCVTKPSTSLGSSEQACLSRCTALYAQAFDHISQKYYQRVMKEASSTPEASLEAQRL
ncbi:Tim10/DDP family zinc finger-domain-containing protein [Kockovaella imperatae]|uniref:Mitochondrial import inner membrane translocase subunit n=1 Tax=Kockovaella imperatae TaxID=4999 RepID=A0A1Y1UI92_9TREE|nr:Tim10/DDP family zinc finger-domain-containing protein [Kockovaella imperatae]ORX37699.1 Tim10/DDP family zinc finger-domain-containing protein [Kockovaella imperatae]